jgi:diguanylate cyclase (GGDEF)-like protein
MNDGNEEKRLQKLETLEILDTPKEERFERITRAVCEALNVPISAISLIDKNRQWFKSIQGLSASETPRNVAFCAHAILENAPLVVPDATLDDRFQNNPLVTGDPSIRFYAGIPLTMEDGTRIGTLCAIDQKPHTITDTELETLKTLTAELAVEIQQIKHSEAQSALICETKPIERAAMLDPFSKLWNKTGAENLLAREIRISSEKFTPVATAFLQIDGFEDIERGHGDATKQKVLHTVVSTLLAVLRPYDALCRWHDDTFLLIVGKSTQDLLPKTLDRIKSAVRQNPVPLANGLLKITLTIGGCSLDFAAGVTTDQILNALENALDTAKTQGSGGQNIVFSV